MRKFDFFSTSAQEAARRGFAPDPKRIETAEAEVRATFADESAFLAFLASQGSNLESFREELRVQETANGFVGAETEKIPVASDEEAAEFFKMHQPDAGPPTSGDIESWRWQITRNKRSMVMRDILDTVSAQAKVERSFEPGTCEP